MKTSVIFKSLVLLPTLLFCTLSVAQEAAATGEDEANSNALEEVMVTATRRGEEDIMSMPISISALTGSEVEKYALRDLNDIAVAIPGLSSGTVSAFKSAQFAMRGVSEQTIILYKESPVGVTLVRIRRPTYPDIEPGDVRCRGGRGAAWTAGYVVWQEHHWWRHQCAYQAAGSGRKQYRHTRSIW